MNIQASIRKELKRPLPKLVGRPRKKHAGGRPSVFTKGNTLQKLETAFSYDMPDEEACSYANISTSTLYNYQKQNPEFLEWKRALKLSPSILARITLVNALATRQIIAIDKDGKQVEIEIPGNTNLARWYLERKRPEEFSSKALYIKPELPNGIVGAKEMAETLQKLLEQGDDEEEGEVVEPNFS